MPERPKRACKHAGCPNLSGTGYCEQHNGEAREVEKQRNKFRGTAASRGYDRDWQLVRLQALQRDKYLCLHCLKDGRVTPAVDVDHIVALRQATERRLELTNLQSLCRSCHSKKTAIDRSL